MWQSALVALLLLTAWETRRRLLSALRRWQKFFESQHNPDALLAEVAKRRFQARTLGAEQMVAAVTDGWDYVAEAGINAVLLVPSQVIWPNSHVFDHQSTKLICYPLAPKPSLKESEPPTELLERFQGVADARRLLILRGARQRRPHGPGDRQPIGDWPDDPSAPPGRAACVGPGERRWRPPANLSAPPWSADGAGT